MSEALTDEAAAPRQRLMSHIPMGRGADPLDALGVVQFLLSDASRFVTGQQIAVDGGYTIF